MVYETVNLLKMAVIRKRLTNQMAHKALHFLAQIPCSVVDIAVQDLSSLLDASMAQDLSSYDAAYFYAAQSRGIELVTHDKDLLALAVTFSWIKKP